MAVVISSLYVRSIMVFFLRIATGNTHVIACGWCRRLVRPPCTPAVPPWILLHRRCGIDLRLLAVVCCCFLVISMLRPSTVVGRIAGLFRSLSRPSVVVAGLFFLSYLLWDSFPIYRMLRYQPACHAYWLYLLLRLCLCRLQCCLVVGKRL
jgi:hypothetical protein